MPDQPSSAGLRAFRAETVVNSVLGSADLCFFGLERIGGSGLPPLSWFANGSPLLELPGHDLPVYRVLFNPDGTLTSADLRGLVIEWDHRPSKEARRLDAGKLSKHNAAGQGVDYDGVRDLALSADGKYLACGGLIEASKPLARLVSAIAH
jgi:WD40 repeat protein